MPDSLGQLLTRGICRIYSAFFNSSSTKAARSIAAKTRKPAVDLRLQELIVGYVAGGAYMLLTQWISNKMPFSAEQMGLLFYDLTDPCENIKLAR